MIEQSRNSSPINLNQILEKLARGNFSEEELNCFGAFTELFDRPDNPLTKFVGQGSFEVYLKHAEVLEDDLVAPFIEKLVTIGLLIRKEVDSKGKEVKIPDICRTNDGEAVKIFLLKD